MGAALFTAQAPTGCLWGPCAACGTVLESQSAEWLSCLDGDGEFGEPGRDRGGGGNGGASGPSAGKARGGRRRRQPPCDGGAASPGRQVAAERLEALTRQLFGIHDLNRNGLLEEEELVSLNEHIAVLHHGKDFDIRGVRETYRALFRSRLHPEGQAVPYAVFRAYAQEVLDGLDDDPEAQEMILEQFVAEAQSGAALLAALAAVKEEEEAASRSCEELVSRRPPALVDEEPEAAAGGRGPAAKRRVQPPPCSSASARGCHDGLAAAPSSSDDAILSACCGKRTPTERPPQPAGQPLDDGAAADPPSHRGAPGGEALQVACEGDEEVPAEAAPPLRGPPPITSTAQGPAPVRLAPRSDSMSSMDESPYQDGGGPHRLSSCPLATEGVLLLIDDLEQRSVRRAAPRLPPPLEPLIACRAAVVPKPSTAPGMEHPQPMVF